jgi:flagellar biosynthesis protein FlhB
MAGENDQAQEKTQEATPKRREDARREGQVARSRELSTFMVLTVPSLALLMFGGQLAGGLVRSMQAGLAIPRSVIVGEASVLEHLTVVLMPLSTLLLLLLVGMLAGMASSVVMGGVVFNPDMAGLKLNRLDPMAGLGRMFGRQAAVELAKGLVKAVWLLLVLVAVIWWCFDDIMHLSNLSIQAALARMGVMVAFGLLCMALATALIAAIDVPWQLWEHGQKLKMSLQDVRDELKETEGRPEVKSRLRQVQMEMSRRRMMDDVRKADVVVTNPTHYSVALRYDPDGQTAPLVVAKGRNEVALRIREVAREAGVILLEQPPLARALYFHTPLGAEIPASLYAAVAQVLAFVFQLRVRGPVQGHERRLPPVEVPVGMDRQEAGE